MSVVALLTMIMCMLNAFGQDGEVRSNALRVAVLEHQTALSNHLAQTSNTVAAWKLARACFELSEFATNDTQLAALARQGIAAARIAIRAEPDEPAGHHYLGVNLGQLARTHLLSALGMVKEMEQAFLASIKADEKFHYAASHRSLAMLYSDAPGWPVSIGSRAKARRHYVRALQLYPDYPENHLSAIETYLDWEDRDYVREALRAYARIVPSARKKYSGERWAQAWSDWEARWTEAQGKAQKLWPEGV